jgi:NCAIR mutase (PurE)-related protein
MRSDANLDLARRQRLGMVEAVWGEHKRADQIAAILRELVAAGEIALVTRVSPSKAAAVGRLLGQEEGSANPPFTHHREARCLTAPSLLPPLRNIGSVAVLTGGTSDQVVAQEARLALRCHGVPCDLMEDVGVAGLHRLLDRLPLLREASVLIVCAGMEGALPTVVGGLLPQPVIAVPVSVGYGVSRGGQAALNGMLASCAPGLTVVNIDNGYGAAMAALRILNASNRPEEALAMEDPGATTGRQP